MYIQGGTEISYIRYIKQGMDNNIYFIRGGTDNIQMLHIIIMYTVIGDRHNTGTLIIARGGGGQTKIMVCYILGGTDTNKYIIYYILYTLILKTGRNGHTPFKIQTDRQTHRQTDAHYAF